MKRIDRFGFKRTSATEELLAICPRKEGQVMHSNYAYVTHVDTDIESSESVYKYG